MDTINVSKIEGCSHYLYESVEIETLNQVTGESTRFDRENVFR